MTERERVCRARKEGKEGGKGRKEVGRREAEFSLLLNLRSIFALNCVKVCCAKQKDCSRMHSS